VAIDEREGILRVFDKKVHEGSRDNEYSEVANSKFVVSCLERSTGTWFTDAFWCCI